jgi:tetrahydromethanopterin S-methyltransferase subunit B
MSYPICFFLCFSCPAIGTATKVRDNVNMHNGIAPNAYFNFGINLVIAALTAHDNNLVGT